MLNFLDNLIIQPIRMLLDFCFENIYNLSLQNIGFTIFTMSFIVFILCLPLYLRADRISQEEKQIQKKLKKRVNSIKKNFKGDEKYLFLATYYRQNNYNPIMSLRLSLSLLLQIPIFIAAYGFFSHLSILEGMQYGLILDLSQSDNLLKIGNFKINILPFIMTFINLTSAFVYLKNKDFKEFKALSCMSLLFLILLYNSPSSLVLYWIFNNFFSFIKNYCLNKYSNKTNLNILIISVTLFYALFIQIFYLDYKYLFILLIGVILFFIFKKINEKILNFDFEYNKLFFLNLFAFTVLIGILIPTNVIATSPVEFIFDARSDVFKIINFQFIQTSGAVLFWGGILYYFIQKKYGKFLAYSSSILLFLALFNFLFIKMPDAILLNNFTFEASDAFKIAFSINKKIAYILVSLVICLIPYFLLRYKKTKNLLSLFALFILITSILLSSYNCSKIYKVLKNYKKITYHKEEKIIHLSQTKKNVLIIFLDRAINSYFPLIIDEHKELLNQYSGFSYYHNVFSYAGYTILGYLPMIGGYEYTPINLDKRDGIFEKKHNEAITMLPALFSLNDWKTSVINPVERSWEPDFSDEKSREILAKNDLYEKYNIQTNIARESINIKYNKSEIKDNFNITLRNVGFYSLICIMPPQIRKYIYNRGNYHNIVHWKDYLPEALIDSYAELYYINRLVDFSSKENNFILFNNVMTHYPAILSYPNYDLELVTEKQSEVQKQKPTNYPIPINVNDENYSLKHYHVNAAALIMVGKFLDYLKENNVYDNTRIIIVADHGYGYNLQNPHLTQFEFDNLIPYNPLLLVKDYNEKGSLKVKSDFMTNADVPLIATDSIISNPTNPFTNKKLSSEKNDGIYIKTDLKWAPNNYIGKYKVLEKGDEFSYIKGNPLIHSNWKLKIPIEEILKK